MTDKIRVLIVDDLPETRENVRKLLQFELDMEVVGQAGNGSQAIEVARQHTPDVILMDINMPGVDGITASQGVLKINPATQIIIMSVQSEADYIRKAMLAGARDFLMKPFSGDELTSAIRRVYDSRPAIAAPVVDARTKDSGSGSQVGDEHAVEGKILAFYSPKGGSGCTTLSTNVAVGLALKGHRVALVDASYQFGDIAVMLGLRPTTTIVDLVDRLADLDAEMINSVLTRHETGLEVLLSPPRPEMAEMVTTEHVELILQQLSQMFDFVVVDTPSALNDQCIMALEMSHRIVLIAQQNLAALANIRRFFELMKQIEFDFKKILLIVNRANDRFGISIRDIGDAMKRPVMASIALDEFAATQAADQGVPILAGKNRNSPLVSSLNQLTENLEQIMLRNGGSLEGIPAADGQQGQKGFFGRLLGR
ncbi:MAG: CpaE family protein [Anaerolineae bacterium]